MVGDDGDVDSQVSIKAGDTMGQGSHNVGKSLKDVKFFRPVFKVLEYRFVPYSWNLYGMPMKTIEMMIFLKIRQSHIALGVCHVW